MDGAVECTRRLRTRIQDPFGGTQRDNLTLQPARSTPALLTTETARIADPPLLLIVGFSLSVPPSAVPEQKREQSPL